jgi:hypothetical protein
LGIFSAVILIRSLAEGLGCWCLCPLSGCNTFRRDSEAEHARLLNTLHLSASSCASPRREWGSHLHRGLDAISLRDYSRGEVFVSWAAKVYDARVGGLNRKFRGKFTWT